MTEASSQIRCPNCNNPISAKIIQLIDIGQQPTLKARMLTGGLNFIQCPVCGYQGQVATPLVYHDPEKEMLLSYMPVELALPKNEQEKIIGRLINQVMTNLEAEQRKAYLLQPQAVLTMQGLIERILEADGVTQEDLENQRSKIRLFEELIRSSDDQLQALVEEHDGEIDEIFMQIASLSLQSTQNEQARQAASERLNTVLSYSTLGKKLQAQQDAIRAAADEIRTLGEEITHEKLLELFIQARDDDHIVALTSLTRPALDYRFFLLLTEKIDSAGDDQKAALESLRSRVLEITDELNSAEQARAQQAAALLRSIIESPDMDQAFESALPLIDEQFLAILRANLSAAEERNDQTTLGRLRQLDQKIQAIIQESLPEGLKMLQELLELDDEQEAIARLEAAPETVDDQMLNTLISNAQRLEQSGDDQAAQRLKNLHRAAVRISMRNNMKRN